MAKAKNSVKLSLKEWLIILLFVLVAATNWVWYQHHQAQELSLRAGAESWLQQQVSINKLKACIDEGKKPCDITPR